MGAIAGQMTNIDETGATSMMWHASPQPGTVTISPQDAYRTNVFLEPLALYLHAEAGTIDHVILDHAKGELSVTFSPAKTLGYSNLRLRLEKTSQARPGADFVVAGSPLVREAYEVTPSGIGQETTVSIMYNSGMIV